jgi:hypothetical protein
LFLFFSIADMTTLPLVMCFSTVAAGTFPLPGWVR